MNDQDKLKLKNYLSINLKSGFNFVPRNPNSISEDETIYISGMTAMKNQIFELIEKYKGVDVPKIAQEERPDWVENTTKYQRAVYEAKDKNNEKEIMDIYVLLGGKLKEVGLLKFKEKQKMEEEKEVPVEALIEEPAEEIIAEEAPAVE